MTSATASACARSIFPLANARRVNSPASASLAPLAVKISSNRRCTYLEPWTDSSTTSSPVNEDGARNTVATPSSSISLTRIGSMTRPNLAVCPGVSASLFPCQILSVIAMACGPLTRMTAIPPMPGGVEIAQIVSSRLMVSLFMAAKLLISRKTCVTLRLKSSENNLTLVSPVNHVTFRQYSSGCP